MLRSLVGSEMCIRDRIEGDLIAQPRFHAKNIVAILPAKKLAESLSVPGHHYAFIAPFADRVKSKENIPVAVDPEGFDRRSFIKRVNSFIVKFFKQSNSPSSALLKKQFS